ncbi:unnamed protein product [Schistosoma margrebowiei]|uniref:Uncharacterized protein n=1 Tax=Schistosoma margrebowiei TaxID=48269 RepID=A0A183MRX6_9TREM|nr:unnamed protein product [Schistosoma margrebowiei]
MVAGDQRLVHTPFVPSGYCSPCAPLVWNQGFPTPLSGLFVSINPVKAPDIHFSSSQFHERHHLHERAHIFLNSLDKCELQKSSKNVSITTTTPHVPTTTTHQKLPQNHTIAHGTKATPVAPIAHGTKTTTAAPGWSGSFMGICVRSTVALHKTGRYRSRCHHCLIPMDFP